MSSPPRPVTPPAGCAPFANNAAAPSMLLTAGGADGGCPSCRQGDSLQAKAADAAARRPPLRAVFMGTPDFAATILERLLDVPHVEVAAVYTQPDRRSGRGQKLLPPPVKQLALRRGLRVMQPLYFTNDPDGDAAFAVLRDIEPDVLVVAAYGLILPQRVLDIPRLMPVNVHASLLPKYRGAAPIQRAIMAGDAVTGVTIMRMEASLDAGPILLQRAVGIGINDTSGSLHDELAREGAELLVQALERLSAGMLAAMPQDDALATLAPKLDKRGGFVDFSLSPAALHARIRGVTPKPGASMFLHRRGYDPLLVQVGPGVFPLTGAMKEAASSFFACRGETNTAGASVLGVVDRALLLTTDDGCYAFSALKPAGKKVMDGLAFYNGYLKGMPDACFSGFAGNGGKGELDSAGRRFKSPG